MRKHRANASSLMPLFDQYLFQNIISIKRMSGGLNSRVYKITCKNNKAFVAKIYPHHNGIDHRDRFNISLSVLRYLNSQGLKQIPKLIKADKKSRIILCEYLPGKKIPYKHITSSDIEQIIAFHIELQKIKEKVKFNKLPYASEGFISINNAILSIRQRLTRLNELEKEGLLQPQVTTFIKKQLEPFYNKLNAWVKEKEEQGIFSLKKHLPYEEMILSLSDFGFHNAVKSTNNQWTFLDFEHCGWDDPCKMISDFLLHPAMDLSTELKKYFFEQIISALPSDETFQERIKIVYPLCCLKWCFIFLNDFMPEHRIRRVFAQQHNLTRVSSGYNQLLKAKKMLAYVKKNYKTFPYDKYL